MRTRIIRQTWIIENHLCRRCGGRVLRCVTGNGVTPGGDPIFKCGDCGNSTSGFSAVVICWCGFHHSGNHNITAYKCVPFFVLAERPELRNAFLSCGCDPAQEEVGIMLEKDFYKTDLVPDAEMPKLWAIGSAEFPKRAVNTGFGVVVDSSLRVAMS